MAETWRDISGYEKYEVSNTGKVRSKARDIIDSRGRNGHRKGKLLSQATCRKGYKFVVLYDANLKSKTVKVHRLVAAAFIDNLFDLPQVNHKDGNKSNNHADNLEWCTNQENIIHAYQRNLISLARGQKHHRSKLSDEEVEWIRKNCIKGDQEFGTHALGRRFGVANITISRIVNGLSRAT